MVSESPSVESELASGVVSADASSGYWFADSSSVGFELPSVEGLGDLDDDVPGTLDKGDGA